MIFGFEAGVGMFVALVLCSLVGAYIRELALIVGGLVGIGSLYLWGGQGALLMALLTAIGVSAYVKWKKQRTAAQQAAAAPAQLAAAARRFEVRPR